MVVDAKKHKHVRRVFLFEDMIMFTREHSEGGSTVYKFKDAWKVQMCSSFYK